MDVFRHQAEAERKSLLLATYFFTAVVLTSVVMYGLALLFVFPFYNMPGESAPFSLWKPWLFTFVALLTLVLVVGVSWSARSALSSGGRVVARWLQSRPVRPNTQDPAERRLLNVVEEMALASGLPVPSVFLMESEKGINAFAAGHSRSDAVIVVTRGALDLLTRDELQGVIAHEFSHILNGDARLNIRLMAVLQGILWFNRKGVTLIEASSAGDQANPLMLVPAFLGITLFAGGYAGALFGARIRAAVSREREYLADAFAVQFTRNPSGIVGALKKIGGLAQGSRLLADRASDVSHMLFADGLRAIPGLSGKLTHGESRPSMRLRPKTFPTHPPLTERIRRIDPRFDGRFPTVELSANKKSDESAPLGFPRESETPGSDRTVGSPNEEHVRYAAALLASIPGSIKSKVYESQDARAVILALVLSHDSAVRQSQFKELTSRDDGLARMILEVSSQLARCPTRLRLPLVDLCLPALKDLSVAQYEDFRQTLDRWLAADNRLDLFEYTLAQVLKRHLDRYFGKSEPPHIQFESLTPLREQCELLLSSLAHAGHEDLDHARQAFGRAVERLELEVSGLTFRPRNECGLKPVRLALEQLALVADRSKRALLEASLASTGHDDRVTILEGELLRAIADVLDYPIPPFVNAA